MHPHDRLHDAARARALELRAQALQAFWPTLGVASRRAWRALRRRLAAAAWSPFSAAPRWPPAP